MPRRNLSVSVLRVWLPLLPVLFLALWYGYMNERPSVQGRMRDTDDLCRSFGAAGCCDDIRMGKPFFYDDWNKMLSILEALNRPWF